jgi:hypothetical protein
MKGMVFTEFLEMVEDRFSPEIADQIIDETDLDSGGAYTRIGTYDHREMIALVDRLSALTGVSVTELLQVYGRHLFGRFSASYPIFFEDVHSIFDFLPRVHAYIHVEVRKLYPDAELPVLEAEQPTPDQLRLTYRSKRPFSPLAEGLIRGCIDHYGEAVEVETIDLSDGSGHAATFVLTRTAPP